MQGSAKPGRSGTGDDDAVGVAAEQPANRGEIERGRVGLEAESGARQKLAAAASKTSPRKKMSRVRCGCTASTIQSYCTRRKHSLPMELAPRYWRLLISGSAAASIRSLIAALIGVADKQVRLKSTTLPQGHGFDQLVSGQQETHDILARPLP